MKITSANGTIENGTSLVGSLDAGGYFTLDAMIIPEQSGKVDLDITIEYTDDFNQPRTVARKLEIEVMEGFVEPTPDPSHGRRRGWRGHCRRQPPKRHYKKYGASSSACLVWIARPPSTNDPGVSPGPEIEEPGVPIPKPGTGKG